MLNTAQRLQLIRQRLQQALNPSRLEIIDESAKHYKHAGAAMGAGHFAVTIASVLFQEKTLVECQRMVYAALGDLIPKEIHALRLKTKVSD